MDDHVKFMDAESYSVASFDKDITFKQIVLQHVNALSGYASKEMRGAYYEDKVGQGGIIQHIYVPDTREIYSNGVNYLADILNPHFDKEMKEAEQKLNDELDKKWGKIWDEGLDTKGQESDTKGQESRYFKMKNRRKLFRELMKFLYRIKYLDLGMLEE